MSTFKNIEEECTVIIKKLKSTLYDQIEMINTSQSIVTESLILLYQLGEPMEMLSNKNMERIQKILDNDLEALQNEIDCATYNNNKKETTEIAFKYQVSMDILEFVDYGCNSFLANLSVSIDSFSKIFFSEKNIKT